MHKLLIHIRLLFALVFLLCTLSASGQSVPSVTATVTTPVPHSTDIVDLGLSVYWANKNIGSKSPQDAGTYFAWGETTYLPPHKLTDYFFYNVSGVYYTKYTSSDNIKTLDLSDDAARYNWQGYWRMPTKENLQSLMQCPRSDNGRTIYSNLDPSVFIILAKSGYEGVGANINKPDWHYTNKVMFWTSTVKEGFVWDHGYCLENTTITTEWRYHGLPIRPVIDKCNIKASVQGKTDILDENFPKGTIITLTTDYPGDCYEVKWKDLTNNYTYPLGYDANGYKCFIDSINPQKICLTIPVINPQTTYKLEYTIKTFDIVVSKEGQGSVEKKVNDKVENLTTITYNCGTKIELTATPNECWKFVRWKETGEIENHLIFDVSKSAKYTAVFEQKAFSVTASSTTGGNASISPSSNATDSSKFLCGTNITLTATPDACYEFAYWEKGGERIDGGATLSVTVSESATYKAVFTVKTTNVKVTTDSSKGWVGLNVWK